MWVVGVECSYTIEASMAGGADNLHFHPNDLLAIGADMCRGCVECLLLLCIFFLSFIM